MKDHSTSLAAALGVCSAGFSLFECAPTIPPAPWRPEGRTTNTQNDALRFYRRLASFGLPVILLLIVLTSPARAALYTNITVANVTPSSFSVVWGAAPEVAATIQVFADPDGQTNLAGQVGIEYLPLRSGSPAAATALDKRLSLADLRAKTRGYGLEMAQITGCRPDTAYYFRLQTVSGSSTNYTPATNALPLARTAGETAFVAEALQLILDVPGQNVAGRIVLLTHTNSPYALAAVVGDGAAANQVVFSVSELLAMGGLSNFTPIGSQTFTAEVLGTGQEGGVTQPFALDFTGAFTVAQSLLGSFSSELASLAIGSTVLQAGKTGTVPVTVYSTVGLDRFSGVLQIPDGHLTNLALTGFAAEVDPAQSSLTPLSPGQWSLNLQALPGQQLFGVREACQVSFVARTNVPSAFVPLVPSAMSAVKPNASLVGNVLLQRGRVVVIGREPLIEAQGTVGDTRHLLVYGNPWATFLIEGTPALGSGNWRVLTRFPSTNLVNLVGVPADGTEFYRAAEFIANPPYLALGRDALGLPQLLVFGQPTGSYTLEYKESLSPTVQWKPLLTFSLTNSFGYLSGLPNTNAATFLRLIKN